MAENNKVKSLIPRVLQHLSLINSVPKREIRRKKSCDGGGGGGGGAKYKKYIRAREN